MPYDLTTAGDVRRDDDAPARRSFEQDLWQPLPIGRQNDHVGCGQGPRHVLPMSPPLDHTLVLPGPDARLGNRRRVLRIDHADEHTTRMDPLRREDPRRFDELPDTL